MSNFKRFTALEKELEPLRIFSSKLKHLQLTYIQYKQRLNEIRAKPDTSQDQIYILEIERMIIELISCISSIRDCLKNKILDTDKNVRDCGKCTSEKPNGKLLREYMTHQPIYKQILAKTLEQDDQKKNIIKMTNALRNLLTHSSLQITIFGDMEFRAEYEPGVMKRFYLLCDYSYLISKLNNKDSKKLHRDIFCQYYLDDHLVLIENSSMLQPKNHSIMIERLTLLSDDVNIHTLKCELLHAINEELNPLQIYLPRTVYQKLLKERSATVYTPLYDKILSLKAYRLLSHKKALEETDKINSRPSMFFNLGLAIYDIYELYFDYYSQLHHLIKQHHMIQLNELEALAIQLGYSKDRIPALKRKYDSTIPS